MKLMSITLQKQQLTLLHFSAQSIIDYLSVSVLYMGEKNVSRATSLVPIFSFSVITVAGNEFMI